MLLSDVETPALIVDLDRLTANLRRVAGHARNADLALWPHTKTHKTPEIAKLQLEHGAPGITVAKIGEAEVMVDAGIEDIFIAHHIVGPDKAARLAKLAERAKVTVAVDSPEAATALSMAFAQRGLRLRVLIEVDIGLRRCGVRPEGVPDLARTINSLPGLALTGVFTYPGHVYDARNENEVVGIAAYECRIMGEVGQQVAPLVGGPPRVSGGSTPTASTYHPECGLTEMRPGSYVFNDRTQIDMWAATPDDCALTVLSTVVSAPESGRAILDAGSKSLATDSTRRSVGYGMLKEDNTAVVVKLNEEHGYLDLSQSDLKLLVGDKVEVIPNHACTVSNLFDEMTVVKEGEAVDTWQIAARGKVR